MDVTLLVLVESAGPDSCATRFLRAHPTGQIIEADGAAARTCAAISALDPAPPLVIAAAGRAALQLPAVALAQRSAHRRVLEYVLLDPVIPTVSDAWPDARVTVVCDVDSEASLQSRLRGWDVLRVEDIENWRAPD
jgi:hypothetical protein